MDFISFHKIGTKVDVSENTFIITKVSFSGAGQYYQVCRTTDEGIYQTLNLYDFEIDKFHSEKQIFRTTAKGN